MQNILTSNPITHILLIDSETPDQAAELIKNMIVVRNGLCEAFSGDWTSHYYLTRVIVPASRTDVADLCNRLKPDLASQEVEFSCVPVAEEDMSLSRGKAGLLTCSFWLMAGSVLLSDAPISSTDAMKLPALSNRLESSGCHMALAKKGFFAQGFRFALLRGGSSIGHLMLGTASRLSDGHTLSDLIQVMKAKCGSGELLSV